MKTLIGTEEFDVGNPLNWPKISIKTKHIKPPDECVNKQMIYMPPPTGDLEAGDHVEIWTDECKYHNHETPLVWVGPFIIEEPKGPHAYWVSTPLSYILHVSVYYEHLKQCSPCCHPPD